MTLILESCCSSFFCEQLENFKSKVCVIENIEIDDKFISTIRVIHKDSSRIRKNIVLIQGRAETWYKYLPLMYELYNKGYNVFTFDHVGQGASYRYVIQNFSYIENFDDYTYFTKKFLEYFGLTDPIIIANSMGCAIAINLLKADDVKPQKIVLISPMIKIKLNFLPFFLVKTISRIMNFFRPLSPVWGQKEYTKPIFEKNYKTHSLSRFNFYHNIYEKYPNLSIGGVTWKWLFESIKNEINFIDCPNIPFLIFIAQNDVIVDNKAIKSFIKRSNASIQHYECKNSFHDILNEIDEIRINVINKIIDYIENE